MSITSTTGKAPDWTLGWRLQRALAHSGLSVADMSTILGVSRSTVSRWMHDQGAPPKAAFVKQWALATGVPLPWLETGIAPQPNRPEGDELGGKPAGSMHTLARARFPMSLVS